MEYDDNIIKYNDLIEGLDKLSIEKRKSVLMAYISGVYSEQ